MSGGGVTPGLMGPKMVVGTGGHGLGGHMVGGDGREIGGNRDRRDKG